MSLKLSRDHKPKGQAFHNGTFIKLIGAYENGLEQEENGAFDTFVLQYGNIIKAPSCKHTKEMSNGMGNVGNSYEQGVATPHSMEYINEKTNSKAWMKVFYEGKPYDCLRCQTIHEGHCSKKWHKEKLKRKKSWIVK